MLPSSLGINIKPITSSHMASQFLNNPTSTIMRSDQMNSYFNASAANMILSQMQQHQQHSLAQHSRFNPMSSSSPIRIELEDRELWTKFHNVTNEMILTKAGRRTFPLIKIKMSGLDESDLYSIHLEFHPSDQLKYRFVNGEWKTSPRNDSIKQTQQPVVHVHPDSPKYGTYWTTNPIAFGKLKLTNNEMSKNEDAVYLKSLNKYTPHVLVYKHIHGNLKNIELVYTGSFVETQFIAVTAYQNEQITNLKIKFNPFAKAFLNNKPYITSIDSSYNTILNEMNQKNVKFESNSWVNPQPKQQQQQPPHMPALPYNHPAIFNNHFMSSISDSKPEFIPNWYPQNPYFTAAQSHQVYNQTQQYPESSYHYPQTGYHNFLHYHSQPYRQPALDHHHISYNPTQFQFDYSNQIADTKEQDLGKDEETDCYQHQQHHQQLPRQSLKRPSSSMTKEDSPPYGGQTVTKRPNADNLDISPVYGHNGVDTKLDFNYTSDDSLNSSNHLTTPYQSNNSASSASSSSFASSSSASSASSSSFTLSSSAD